MGALIKDFPLTSSLNPRKSHNIPSPFFFLPSRLNSIFRFMASRVEQLKKLMSSLHYRRKEQIAFYVSTLARPPRRRRSVVKNERIIECCCAGTETKWDMMFCDLLH